jgi:hypothetical protein
VSLAAVCSRRAEATVVFEARCGACFGGESDRSEMTEASSASAMSGNTAGG